MSDIVRVIRILEYVGEREWVEMTLERSIQGTFHVPGKAKVNLNIIKAVTLGSFPEIIARSEEDDGSA